MGSSGCLVRQIWGQVELSGGEQDPDTVVGEIQEAPCRRLDGLDLAVDLIAHRIGDGVFEVS